MSVCLCVCVVGHKFVCMIGSNNFICLRLCSLPKQPTSDRRRRRRRRRCCCCLCLGAVASLIRPDDSADFVAPVRSCGQQELPELGVHLGSCVAAAVAVAVAAAVAVVRRLRLVRSFNSRENCYKFCTIHNHEPMWTMWRSGVAR